MRSSGWLVGIATSFAVLTLLNAANYSVRLRELNEIPLRSNPLGGDALRIGTQAVHDRQSDFWLTEAAVVVLCGVAWLLATRKRLS